MAFTYILLTVKGKYYIGSAENLEKRIKQHENGEVMSTKSALPIMLVYKEYFHNRAEAQKKEYKIKSWKSRRLIESLIKKTKSE
ncbi:GIY-YIG nuclease family protein [Candidatus Uhrbacteria bacterium]|nr:GIY-YIG nuclease family protein [Candidatus Uhrbacteria bacterium]